MSDCPSSEYNLSSSQIRGGGGVGAWNEIVLLNFNANLIYFSYHFLVDPANFLLSLLLMQTLKCSSMICSMLLY